MKINHKILSIPPYVSTAWKNVVSLHLEAGNLLVISLVNGSKIEIPNLDLSILTSVFASHEKFLEQESQPLPASATVAAPLFPVGLGDDSPLISIPLRFDIEGKMGHLLQHSIEGKDMPPLPQEVLDKIGKLANAIGLDHPERLSKPEPHCHCMHCQIMRKIHEEQGEAPAQQPVEEEGVLDTDLRFREWDIEAQDEKLFLITNPLNPTEHYTVYLGNPVGCTCGSPNCEHIRAVLNS